MRHARAPRMTKVVRRMFHDLHASLIEGRDRPLDALLEPYYHLVHPVGACNHFPFSRAKRFCSTDMTDFFKALFRDAADVLNCRLSRFDLHHAHLVHDDRTHRLCAIFHAKEYPAKWEEFPYELGYCQTGSNVVLREEDMRFRNLTWCEDWFWLLDGGARLPFGTFYEREFGDVIADVYFFDVGFGELEEAVNRGVHVFSYGDEGRD